MQDVQNVVHNYFADSTFGRENATLDGINDSYTLYEEIYGALHDAKRGTRRNDEEFYAREAAGKYGKVDGVDRGAQG